MQIYKSRSTIHAKYTDIIRSSRHAKKKFFFILIEFLLKLIIIIFWPSGYLSHKIKFTFNDILANFFFKSFELGNEFLY